MVELKIKVESPLVENYGLVVYIPLSASLRIPKKLSVVDARSRLSSLKKSESDLNRKSELGRAIALLDFAYYCNAGLTNIWYEEEKLKFAFIFYSFENMVYFRDYMSTVVARSTTFDDGLMT